MKRSSSFPKMSPALAAVLWLLASALAVSSLQEPQVTPTASPTASVSPTPARTASPTPLPGAQNFHQWGSITVFNGLPSDSVRAIAQTADGVMWFGTDNGLARFDGRRVQRLSPSDNRESDLILSLEYDEKSDALWVGTQSGAFLFLHDRFEPVAGTEGYAIPSLLLWDGMYFGTNAGLVLRLNGQTATPIFNEVIRGAGGTPAPITGLAVSDGRLLVAASDRGVFVVSDGKPSKFSPSMPLPSVNAIITDADKTVWLATDAPKGASGLSEISSKTNLRLPAPTGKLLSLELNDGLWAGSERYGLFNFVDGKLKKTYTFANTSGGLRSDTIFALFTDREGVLWIGTNRGVSRFDRSGAYQQTVSDIPNSNFVRTLFRTGDGHLYAGSNRGLFELSGDNWREVLSLRNKVVYSLADSNGSTIAGTPDGIFNISGQKVSGGDTRCLAVFKDRPFAAVFGSGVLDIARNNLRPVYQNNKTTCVAAGKERLWIGTDGAGLFSYDGTSTKQEADAESLKSGTIWKIAEADDGSLWIAGQHGVFRLFNGNVEQVVAAEDVRDILPNGNEFWAATTTRGVLHAKHDEKLGWLVSSIAFEQGLPSEKAFSILRIADGVLIATNRGVVTYRPRKIEPKIIPVRVLSQTLHDLRETSSTIALGYPQNSILVEVAGLSSRTFPEEFQYSFVLTNAKDEVVDQRFSNDPHYNPTELKPGNYTIESVAFDRDLNASEPLVIKFSVAKAPFPWTATALGVLLVIALIGLVWAAFEHRRIRQRNRELAVARFDLANEAERERSRIARDLHDQTLADLRNLLLKSDKGVLTAPELRGEIESVSTEIRRICEDLSPSVLENVGLIAALEFLLTQTIENHVFSAEPGVEEKIEFPLNVQLQIYRIAQEVLTNIKRHSDASSVEMSVAMPAADQFKLMIADNGSSFKPDGAGKGRGIANIRARAGLINAKAAWKNGREHGNVFSLLVKSKR